MPVSIVEELEKTRKDLLDLSMRNRLLNSPWGKTRANRLEIAAERSSEVFRLLVDENKAMSFLPAEPSSAPADAEASDSGDETFLDESYLLEQPEEEEPGPLSAAHLDTKLQTRLVSEQLQSRLNKLEREAKTFLEEQGINVLYLALGFLRWYESPGSDQARYAPLILVPVDLQRKSVQARYRIGYTGDEITTNLTLQERLKTDFGIALPDYDDETPPPAYFEAVRGAIRDIENRDSRWEVLENEIVLGFYSFSKLLMFRDLDPKIWPEEKKIDAHPHIGSLLGGGYPPEGPLFEQDQPIDDRIPLDRMVHVMDADSSQAKVIETVRRGRSLVVQGPPGTGKSQTIANMIATAVYEGKRVLFVAEKMAALEVVKRRLANIGLGDICLELHSRKTNKRAVLDELKRTLELGRPASSPGGDRLENLRSCRDRLNDYASILHRPIQPAGRTPFEIIGENVRLQRRQTPVPACRLQGAVNWRKSVFEENERLLGDLVVHLNTMGCPPAEHPWRGARIGAVTPTDAESIAAQAGTLIAPLEQLQADVRQLAEYLTVPADPLHATATAWLYGLAQFLLKFPQTIDRDAIVHPIWQNRPDRIARIVADGQQLSACRLAFAQRHLNTTAWTTDVSAARQSLKAHGKSWFRFLYPEHHRAMAVLRNILNGDPPRDPDERVRLLDLVMEGQRLAKGLADPNTQQTGREAFGRPWRDDPSDWAPLEEIVRWNASGREGYSHVDYRRIAASLQDTEPVRPLLLKIKQSLESLLADWKTLRERLKLDLPEAFGVDRANDIPFAELARRLESWTGSAERLSQWIQYQLRRTRLAENGLLELTEQLHRGELSSRQVADQFRLLYFNDLANEMFRLYPQLSEFTGASHERILDEFKKLDKGRIVLTPRCVVEKHYEAIPRGAAGEMGIIRTEIEKKRRHKPLRQLFASAGRAIQQIKPVFMMSPLSVAQFLLPGGLDFDLLLVDEASQIRPVDALGAIARVGQIVVVGDDQQLPPTSFFDRVIGDEEAYDEEEAESPARAGDMESILKLCSARGVGREMLNWHYRSRHHSLIAVSNRAFYENRLNVIPSPTEQGNGEGLDFVYLSEGSFDRGRSRINRTEAQTVADAVMQHAERFPRLSLGVGTFSLPQREAILDELELRRRRTPGLESFFAPDGPEPFFVKNLENIQGDERDVILLSVGYGKDEDGRLTMNFGPLNADGGHRRLNVLITRARQRCVVYSSIHGHQIDLSRTQSRGAEVLRTFLEFAENKRFEPLAGPSGREPDSLFEQQVAAAIRDELGYDVVPQVGVAGFFIDLAVPDPDAPGRYLLGIECDGAAYHRALSARDRDRLRQQVLEDHGWIIHRIWSTDWFKQPGVQLQRLHEAIERAKVQWAARVASSGPTEEPPAEAPRQTVVVRDVSREPVEPPQSLIETVPYQKADFPIPLAGEIHEQTTAELAGIVQRIVQIEGPIHREEVARRMTQLWGLGRTGSRIHEAVKRAVDEAVRRGMVRETDPFLAVPDSTTVRIRDRSEFSHETLARPEMIPPREIDFVLIETVRDSVGIDRRELAGQVASLLGLGRVTAGRRERFDERIDVLLADGRLLEREGKLYLGPPDKA